MKLKNGDKLHNLVEKIQSKRKIRKIERVKLCLIDDDEKVKFDGKQQDQYGNPNLQDVFNFSDEVIEIGLFNIYASGHNVVIRSVGLDSNQDDECLPYIIVGKMHDFQDHPIPANGASIPMKQQGGFFSKKEVCTAKIR